MRLKWSMSSSSTAGGRWRGARAAELGRQHLAEVAAVADARQRVGAGQVVGLPARGLERVGLAPCGADGGLQHPLQRQPARSRRRRCRARRRAAGRAAGQARKPIDRVAPSRPMIRTDVLGRLAAASRTRWRSKAGRSSGWTARAQAVTRSAVSGSVPPRIRSQPGPAERRRDRAVAADRERVQLVADGASSALDGLRPPARRRPAPRRRSRGRRPRGGRCRRRARAARRSRPAASGAPSARRPIRSCGTSAARSRRPGRNCRAARRPARRAAGPAARRARRCRPGWCRPRAIAQSAAPAGAPVAAGHARSAAACSRRVYRRSAREG